MRLNCPHCGTRSIEEFVQLGAAGLQRPASDAELQAWVDYVYLRDNPAGAHEELFQHAGGCRAMLAVRRDTRTHAVLAVRTVQALRQELAGAAEAPR
jgi:heterotetrameric sarcosine oxidase delta subunit